MNDLIESIFSGFSVPVSLLHYEGHGEPYVTYQQSDADGVLSGDDGRIGYVDYYDFDVYSRGSYEALCESVIKLLEQHGFVWQPSRSSGDFFETDTGYYHRTLNFAILRED